MFLVSEIVATLQGVHTIHVAPFLSSGLHDYECIAAAATDSGIEDASCGLAAYLPHPQKLILSFSFGPLSTPSEDCMILLDIDIHCLSFKDLCRQRLSGLVRALHNA